MHEMPPAPSTDSTQTYPMILLDEDAQGDDGGNAGDPVAVLNMCLMDIDAEIRSLYNQILAEINEEPRNKLAQELQNLKGISTELHEVLSKLAELDPEIDSEDIERIVRRDVRAILNDVRRLYDQCQQQCPGACDSCGAKKIDEVAEKLKEYKAQLEDLEETDAMENIRTETMTYL